MSLKYDTCRQSFLTVYYEWIRILLTTTELKCYFKWSVYNVQWLTVHSAVTYTSCSVADIHVCVRENFKITVKSVFCAKQSLTKKTCHTYKKCTARFSECTTQLPRAYSSRITSKKRNRCYTIAATLLNWLCGCAAISAVLSITV